MSIAERSSLYEVSYFHEMHKDSKGIIGLMKLDKESDKDKRCTMRYSRYSTMVKKHLQVLGEEDLYFTQNTFKALSKAQEHLLELNALYLDIDYYNTEYTKEQVIGNIRILVDDHEIPYPTFIVDSGRGLYVIWKINNVPAQVLPLWRVLMKNFYEKMKYLGADPRCLEPSRVFRVDGSINSENKKIVHVIDHRPMTYSINDLQTEYLQPILKKQRVSRPKYTYPKKENVLYLRNSISISLYHKRIEDIQTLVSVRKGKMNKCRELSCFLIRYWTYCATGNNELALKRAIDLNNQFDEPLEEKEVLQWTKAPDRALKLRAYKYSNKRLIELLHISDEEQEQLQSVISERERNKRKAATQKEKRRNKKGLTQREQNHKNTLKQIKKYYKKGHSQREIADILGLSIPTIKRYYKEIKK